MYYTVACTQFCELILVGNEEGLKNIHLNTGEGKRDFMIEEKWIRNDQFFDLVLSQLEEYWNGDRTEFDIKLNPDGTDYQKKVWNELAKIPFGTIVSYKDIAISIGNPNASRAVGMANGKNPIPIIVPCHRVIGKNGKLIGFAHGLAIKQILINHESIMNIYNTLLRAYGESNWWPAKSEFHMMVGAILTQNTTWNNVEKAINNFGDRLSEECIKDIDINELAQIIRPSGYYNQKAKNLKALVKWYGQYNYNADLIKKKECSELRQELLQISGVGNETADSILVYAFDKESFVIDTYTRRLFARLGFDVPSNYDDFRVMFEKAIPKDIKIYNELHALIVRHAKEHCTKKPKCKGCPLFDVCSHKEKNNN